MIEPDEKNTAPLEGPAFHGELEPGARPPSRLDPIAARPTETFTGLAGATVLYGWLAERGIPNGWAAAIAAVVAFLPALVSEVVDVLQENAEAERLERQLEDQDAGGR